MRPIAPRLVDVDERLIGEDNSVSRAIVVGEGVTDSDRVCLITRWRLSDVERKRIARGEDLFLYITAVELPPAQLHVGSPYHEIERESQRR